ncbi:uncharacterized protein [Miscanthus floridulus]|uniref:uncharacterized protein n=1 Tax=Miscanthus floridulus TaxID=154761 RepID=UPI003457539D
MGVVPPPPPSSLQRMRGAVQKLLCPHSGWKLQAEAPALAPRKALKVSTSSTAQWVMEAQAAIQRGAASARADPKEPDAQGEVTEAATKRVGKEAPMSLEAEAHELDEAEVPSAAEATEGEAEAPRTSKAEATEAGASRTTKAEVAEARAPGTTEAEVAEASMGAAESVAQEAEMEAGQASVPPPVQGSPLSQESAREVEVHSISSDDTSRGKEVVDAKAACTIEQPAPTSGEGSSALVWELEARSLRKSLFLRRERDVWDQLRQQKDLLANAIDLLLARSAEVEDLRLRCADMKAEAATAREQAIPLAAQIKELEEELTRVASEWDTFKSRAKEAAASAKAIARVGEGVHERLWGALHTGVKRALAVVSSHYADIDLKAVNDSYILAEDDEEAEEEVMRLVEVAEAPGTTLAKLFEEEVVPPTPSTDASDPEF